MKEFEDWWDKEHGGSELNSLAHMKIGRSFAREAWKASRENLENQEEMLKQTERIVHEIWDMFYGKNLNVGNWHLNGDVEAMDHFFEENDWDLDAR